MNIRFLLTIGFSLLVFWYAIFLAGTFQFRALQKKTKKLVLDKAKEYNENGTTLSCEEIFKAVYSGMARHGARNRLVHSQQIRIEANFSFSGKRRTTPKFLAGMGKNIPAKSGPNDSRLAFRQLKIERERGNKWNSMQKS